MSETRIILNVSLRTESDTPSTGIYQAPGFGIEPPFKLEPVLLAELKPDEFDAVRKALIQVVGDRLYRGRANL